MVCGNYPLPHDDYPESVEVLRHILPARLRYHAETPARTTNPDESAYDEYVRREKEAERALSESHAARERGEEGDSDKPLMEPLKMLPALELSRKEDYEYLWEHSPVALVCPEGTEVEVAYDPERPDDARIICEGGTDGTFVSVRDILLRTISWMGFCGLAVASVSAICALHGWKLGWVVAAVAVLGTVVMAKEDANRPWNI